MSMTRSSQQKLFNFNALCVPVSRSPVSRFPAASVPLARVPLSYYIAYNQKCINNLNKTKLKRFNSTHLFKLQHIYLTAVKYQAPIHEIFMLYHTNNCRFTEYRHSGNIQTNSMIASVIQILYNSSINKNCSQMFCLFFSASGNTPRSHPLFIESHLSAEPIICMIPLKDLFK